MPPSPATRSKHLELPGIGVLRLIEQDAQFFRGQFALHRRTFENAQGHADLVVVSHHRLGQTECFVGIGDAASESQRRMAQPVVERGKRLVPDFGEGRRFLRLGTLRQGPKAFSPRPGFAPSRRGFLGADDALLRGGVEGVVPIIEQALPIQFGQRADFDLRSPGEISLPSA